MSGLFGSVIDNRPHGRIHLGSDQLDIPNDTITKVLLDEVENDPLDGQYKDGIEDIVNHRITPGVAGLYICFAEITWKNAVIDKLYRTTIYRNYGVAGNRILGIKEQFLRYAGGDMYVSCAGHGWLDADDYIEVYAYHFAGVGTVDIALGGVNTYLFVQRVR